MKKIFTLAISVAVAALASVSCSSLMEKDINPGGNQVQFKTNISSFATKADQSLNGFQSGDAVGVIAMEPILKLNVKYTADGNKLVSDSPICWLEGQDRETEFMAYYPYDPEFNYLTEYQYNISVKTDQSTPENYHASDFLTAWADAYPGETVKFEFTHVLSRVDLAVAGELAQKIVSVSLCGVGATYNVGNDGVGEPTSIKAAEITSGNKKFWSVIIVPQVANPTLEIVTSDGAKKTVALNKEVRFESGKRYQAELRLTSEGSLEAEFVYRVFDWLNGDYVWFDAYRERWSVCGNFCDWNADWAYEMEREAKGIYSAVIDLPEEAEFKFVKENNWDDCFGAAVRGDDGEYRSVPLSIGQVVDLLPGGEGVNLYYPQGGRVRIILNTIEKTATIQPGNDWYIVRYDNKDEYESLFTYTGEGYNYVAERYYATAGTKFYLRNDNWRMFGASLSDGEYEYDEDGNAMKKLVFGEPLKLYRNGISFYFDKTGFVDLALDADKFYLTVTECQDQSVSVEDAAKLPDGTAVSFESITVYAASTEGYVVSLDGKTGLNVYVGLGNPVPAVGDVISLSGTKATYCQLPELVDATFNVLSHSDLGEVQYQNYSGTLTSSIPVKLTGTLKVRPFTKQEVCLLQTNKGLFRMHYLPEDYLKYYNSTVTVTGWFGGYANDFCYITITSMEGLTEKQMAAGTLKDPFDPVDAVLYSRSLAAGSESAEEVYIRGYVSEIVENYSTAVPAATFRITAGGDILSECYFGIDKAFFLEGKPWQLGNTSLERYNHTVVCAKVCVAEDGRTTNTVAEKGYIYSLNGRTSEKVDPVEYIGDGTAENPFNVPAAIAYVQKLEPNTPSDDAIYIKGKISGINEEFGNKYGNATFYISDSGERGIDFYAYRVMYLGNRKWRNGDTQIKDGADVVICGKVANYNGNTPETVGGKAYLYTLNGVTVEPVVSAITIDGDFSDWEALDPEKYSVAYSAPYPRLSALKVLKAHADDNALFVYIEYDTNKIRWEKDVEHVPFHLYIDSDDDIYTGGWDFGFKEPGIDYMLESLLFDGGEAQYLDCGLFRWAGGNTEQGWYWNWIDDYSNGSTGAGNGNGAYEIRLERDALPLGDNFAIGVDIQQDWDSVGLLPNENKTGNNPNGEASLLPVNTNGPGVVIQPGEPEEEEPTYYGWSVIGSIQGHSWDYDIPMYQCYQSGGYYALIYYREGEEFKLRKDGSWAVNRGIGGNGGTGGYTAVQDGPNIILPKTGIYEVFYYPDDGDYIYIQEFANDSWGITGDLEDLGWNGDHIASMAYADDNLNPVIEFTTVRYNEGERFKIRFQGAWNLEYGLDADWSDDGASVIDPGYTYNLRPAGSNIGISQAGVYNVIFNMYDGLVKVERLGDNKDITIPELSSMIAGSGATGSSSAVAFSGFVENVLVTYVNGTNAYLSGNGGNLLLYQTGHRLTEGDVISGFVAGSGYVYSGLPEITDLGSWYKVDYNIGAVSRDEVTIAELLSDYNSNLSRIVRLSGVTVTAASGRNGTIEQDGTSIALYAQNRSIALPAVNSVGNITVVVTTYNGNPQLGFWEEGWFEKTGEVEQTNPGGETGGEDYSNKVGISTGTNAWYDGVATVNGAGNVPVLKFGTSSKFGDATLTIPAGTKSLTFYGFAWKGTTASLKFSYDGKESLVTVVGNDGVAGSSPYTINCAATDKITLDFGETFTADTQVKVETFEGTSAVGKRAVLFAIQPHAE